MTEVLRPYASAFASRFTLVMQYRSAALAGFGTQCWWGVIKIMVLSAFFTSGAVAAAAAADAPMSLSQVITYTWLAQGLLVLLPWAGDPELAASVRDGGIAYDRLRPVDAQGLWSARAAGWIAARALPRALLMLAFAALLLPAIGLARWSWAPPAGAVAGLLFAPSLVLAVLLSATLIMLMHVAVLRTLDARGVNALAGPLLVVFSGNLLPLALLPDAAQPFLLAQPFAGLIDIPLRIYTGQLAGPAALAGLGLQLFWLAALTLLVRVLLTRALRTLEIQGG